MPVISNGGTATFTVAAGDYILIVTGPNGFATLEAVGSPGLASGERRWTRINGRQVFGPWQAGTVRINALADAVDYEFGAQVRTDDADRPAMYSDASGSSLVRPSGGVVPVASGASIIASDAGTEWAGAPLMLSFSAELLSGGATTVLLEVRDSAGSVSTAATITADTVAQVLRQAFLPLQRPEYRFRRSSGSGDVRIIV